MNPPLTRCFLRVLCYAIAMVLSASPLIAQQPAQAPASPQTVPAQKEQSQLPLAPVPGNVSPSTATTGVAPPPTPASSPQSSYSSSDPVPRFWTSADPNAQVTVLENTLFRVMPAQPLRSRHARAGMPGLFTLSKDVVVDNVLIIPRGATLHGTVVESKPAGTLTGSPDLILKLVSLDLGGRSYPLYTYQFKVQGASKTKPTETKIKGGVVIGAIVGGVFSGSAKGQTTAVGKLAGMGTGAALGAGTATVVSAASPGPRITIPAESQIDFYLSLPISVVPATAKDAAKLSQGMHRGGPVLYVRGDTP